ncbi:MAG: LpxI family protein [Maricaulaceae bacterium]
MKVGLIAGSGGLPLAVIEGCRLAGYDIYIAAIENFVDDTQNELKNASRFGLAKIGAITKAFKKEKCTHVCFAGIIDRPDFSKLKPDFKGWKMLPGVISAARQGDDALLSYILETFEREGFEVIGPQELCAHILMPEGVLGSVKLGQNHRRDAEKACYIAKHIGALDIGQAAIVCDGLVLAVEAQEGTDGMLRRISALPAALRGTEKTPKGVLAKMVKPGQESRIDLPTIGLETIKLVKAAGLAGIVTESGRSFVLDREDVIKMADANNIFIAGLPNMQSSTPLGS